VFIEFLGSPCSGKDTVINLLGNLRRVNHVDEGVKSSVFDNTEFCLRVIDSTLISYRIQQQQKKGNEEVTIFNRGLLDRVVFLRYLSNVYPEFATVSLRLESWLLSSYEIGRVDKGFIFLTPPKKALDRMRIHRSNQIIPGRIVNESTIQLLNLLYRQLPNATSIPLVFVDDTEKDLSIQDKVDIVLQGL
jgi:hypothetical protein